MTQNLISTLTGLLGNSSTIGLVSSMLGEDSSKTQSAITSAVPALLGGLLNKASDAKGASEIFGMLKDGNHDGGVLDNVSGLLSSNTGFQGLLSSGFPMLKSLFGDKADTVVNGLAHSSGISASSSSSLLSMAAPLLMGAVGKEVKSKGLDATGMMGFLGSQAGFLKEVAPAGLLSWLGLSSFDSITGKFSSLLGSTTSTVSNVTNQAANVAGSAASMATGAAGAAIDKGAGIGRFLFPILLGAAALIGGFMLLRGCNNEAANKMKDVANTVQNTASDAAKTVGNAANSAVTATESAVTATGAAANAVVESIKSKLPSGVELNVSKGSLEDNFITYLADPKAEINKTTWFDFDNLNFETGSDKLTEASKVQLTNVYEILKAYPNVSIMLGGYTDNVGSESSNKRLSEKRATYVSHQLEKMGIEKARLAHKGYGQEHPVASNDTEEGRAKNRRISINVTKK
jgi:OOP family OmpA-OmpF porin